MFPSPCLEQSVKLHVSQHLFGRAFHGPPLVFLFFPPSFYTETFFVCLFPQPASVVIELADPYLWLLPFPKVALRSFAIRALPQKGRLFFFSIPRHPFLFGSPDYPPPTVPPPPHLDGSLFPRRNGTKWGTDIFFFFPRDVIFCKKTMPMSPIFFCCPPSLNSKSTQDRLIFFFPSLFFPFCFSAFVPCSAVFSR